MKWVKRILIALIAIVFIMVIGLFIYSRNPYQALSDMDSQIEALTAENNVTVSDTKKAILFETDNPLKQVIIIPGGLVEADAYQYLGYSIAAKGYNVVIIKPLFHLAILQPNLASNYIDDSLDTILVGHSLGGVVASNLIGTNGSITGLVLLGSYSTNEVSKSDVLVITASNDLVLNQTSFEKNKSNLPSTTMYYEIDGGNHAGFGWYGPQDGDGERTISIKEQQDLIIEAIINYIEN